MAIEWQILGQAGADNALFVTIDTGQSRESLLFDCGEGCLRELRPSTIQSIEHLFFSHFHMDHVCGFDTFFRHNYNRPDSPVHVWGPPGTIDVMWHRFRGFIWNLHADQPGEWVVRELSGTQIETARFYTREAFAEKHPLPTQQLPSPVVHRASSWHAETRVLPHGSIPSLAYRIVEAPRKNIDPGALQRLGVTPGPWMKGLIDPEVSSETEVPLANGTITLSELRSLLLTETPGESLAYLTDFRIEPGTEAWSELTSWLAGTTTLVCECQYRSEDAALARKNGHMSSDLVGRLAAEAGVGKLVLQHLSRRYSSADWQSIVEEAAAFFPATSVPPEWSFDL
jgi:ribonuclease Z